MEWKFGRGEGPVALLILEDGTALGATLIPEQQQALQCLKATEGFTGKARSLAVWHSADCATTLYAGVGRGTAEDVRLAVMTAVRWCRKCRQPALTLHMPQLACETCAEAAAEAAFMAGYAYTAYLTDAEPVNPAVVYGDMPEAVQPAALEGALLGKAVCISRDLVNEPANDQTPVRLAEEVTALGETYGFEVSVYDEEAMRAWGMKALLAVSQGSPNPPRLIVMRYTGAPESDVRLGLIGKGITFDSGGVNLKRNERIITMKHDMAGGACVAGTMCAIAGQKLPVNVTAVIAACENLVGSNAYKPGDIIGSMKGKTILIKSTDAEGRLSLIDAMQYAIRHEHVTALADIATLTGAARMIYGEYACPYMCPDEALSARVAEAGRACGETLLPFTLLPEMKEKIKGDICDLCNTARSDTGGMITAGLFLQEFTDGLPWAHIDAAGVLWLDRDKDYLTSGGSGFGTRTLYHLAKGFAQG